MMAKYDAFDATASMKTVTGSAVPAMSLGMAAPQPQRIDVQALADHVNSFAKTGGVGSGSAGAMTGAGQSVVLGATQVSIVDLSMYEAPRVDLSFFAQSSPSWGMPEPLTARKSSKPCCDDCGQAEALGKPKPCGANNGRVPQSLPTSGLLTRSGLTPSQADRLRAQDGTRQPPGGFRLNRQLPTPNRPWGKAGDLDVGCTAAQIADIEARAFDALPNPSMGILPGYPGSSSTLTTPPVDLRCASGLTPRINWFVGTQIPCIQHAYDLANGFYGPAYILQNNWCAGVPPAPDQSEEHRFLPGFLAVAANLVTYNHPFLSDRVADNTREMIGWLAIFQNEMRLCRRNFSVLTDHQFDALVTELGTVTFGQIRNAATLPSCACNSGYAYAYGMRDWRFSEVFWGCCQQIEDLTVTRRDAIADAAFAIREVLGRLRFSSSPDTWARIQCWMEPVLSSAGITDFAPGDAVTLLLLMLVEFDHPGPAYLLLPSPAGDCQLDQLPLLVGTDAAPAYRRDYANPGILGETYPGYSPEGLTSVLYEGHIHAQAMGSGVPDELVLVTTLLHELTHQALTTGPGFVTDPAIYIGTHRLTGVLMEAVVDALWGAIGRETGMALDYRLIAGHVGGPSLIGMCGP